MSTHIFVFGSNTQGRHGAGAAYHAKTNYGAVDGRPYGLWGNSYAIITKDLAVGIRSIPLDEIERQVIEFNQVTKEHPDDKFMVTGIGTGLAGYSIDEIAPMFKKLTWGTNVFFSQEFINQ